MTPQGVPSGGADDPSGAARARGRLGPIAGHADDDAVCRGDLLDLDPFALPGQVAAVGTFGHHAFEARHEPQPFLSFQDRPSVRDQLQDRASIGAGTPPITRAGGYSARTHSWRRTQCGTDVLRYRRELNSVESNAAW